MLDRIEITNFATIEHLAFDLGEGLNIITGETGAGKSVLVQAINTALGGRADTSLVRSGTEKALIQIAGSRAGEEVILTRELNASGKSICKCNGELISLGQLRTLCHSFVDIHGQYDNQRILDPEQHLAITDRFRSERLTAPLAACREAHDAYGEAKRDYDALLRSEAEAKRQQDFYRFEADYLTALNPRAGEEEELRKQLTLIRNSERIYSAVAGSYGLLKEDESAILSALDRCRNELQTVSSYSEALDEVCRETTDLYYRLEEVASALRRLTESVDFSAEESDALSERLNSLEEAKRKYGMTIDELIAYRQELSDKLALIENFDSEKERLHARLREAEETLLARAEEVSLLRRENAAELDRAMAAELSDLAFANAEFHIALERLPAAGPLGIDKVEFLISTNPGEPLRPLARIASGGEISRIMLAFKHIVGDTDRVETMIFDEIDTGISGQTALVVGHKLREIAAHHQILCITHLPQIAAYGNDNYFIAKEIFDEKSHTVIRHLDEEGKLRILARLISGNADSESARTAAKELIVKAGQN